MGATPSLLSVNVGLPKNVAWHGRTVYTGVWKESVPGPQMVRRLNIDGDGQGDLAGHGGEQRAVLVYQIESYRHWQQHFGRDDFVYGSFGENLTVDGLPDDEVCIGDRYRIGEVEFEVTQPRVTCYRVGLRLGEPELPALLVSHHRPGFYMRVLTEGHIEAGDEIVKTATGPGALSVSDTDALLYLPHRDEARLRRALQIPAMSPGWRQSFVELVADDNRADASAAGDEPGWNGFRTLVVTKVVPETASVSSISLAAPDGTPLPAGHAGQYLTIRVTGAGAPGQPAPVRSYSLSSAPDTGSYRISVKREQHGIASAYLIEHLTVGATLEVAALRGEFVLDDETNPVLLISAGIGVTPVLSMLYQLAATGSRRDIWWIHGARGPKEHALATETQALLASLPNARTHLFYSAATADECRRAHATPGRVTQQQLTRLAVPSDAGAFVCGPEAFMAEIENALTTLGVDPSRIHTERFGAIAPITPGITERNRPAPHPPDGPPGTGPLVTFARSGISAPIDLDGESVLDLADACDVDSRWSCRAGVCQTCSTPLVSGRVAYRPAPLDDPPAGEVLICCARPETDIVLDM